MISINTRDPRPIYEQIKEGLCRLILSGVLQTGERLPSVRELAGQLAINPNTIQRAYRELELEGFIYSMAPLYRLWSRWTTAASTAKNSSSGRQPRSCCGLEWKKRRSLPCWTI